ncbi:MAG: Gldg family protein [Spirochaetales bacterium]|nr:Gldg family protein [Spirochaetales bacterium]
MIKKKELLRFALYALVIVLLNIALQTVFFRIDLTSNNAYSLTDVSRKMAGNLEEPLTVKFYISENLPYPYNNLEQNIKDSLEEYSLAGNRNFNYYVYTVKTAAGAQSAAAAEIEADAKSYGINPIQIQKVDNSEIKLISAYMGAVFIHADMVETIPVINPSENIEYLITSAVTSIQEKTSKLLSLEENISMKLYLSSSLFGVSDDLRTYPEKLTATVDSLNRMNYNRIDFEWFDTDKDAAAGAEAADYGFKPFSYRDEKGALQEAYASAVLEYGETFTSFDVLNKGLFGYSIQDPIQLENELNGVIEKIIGVGNKIAWLADHGTIQMYSDGRAQYGEPTVSAFLTLASERYAVQPVSITEGSIPDDVGSMIIARPQPFTPFNEWELYQIDQFLMKGGNIAVFMDGYMEYIPQPQQGQQQQAPVYIPRNTGLEKLLEHYGVTVEKSFVYDENCFHQQQQSAEGIMDIPVYFAPEIKPGKINSGLPYLDGIKGLIMLNSSPVKISENLPEGRRAEVLFSSSDDSWLADEPEKINLYNPMMIFPPASAEDKQSYPLAAVLEGSFTSYFADKNIPSRPQPEEGTEAPVDNLQFGMDELSRQENMISSTDEGKLFVFGSSFTLSDSLVDKNGTSTNSIMVMNILDELNGKGDFSVMRKKGLSYNPLDETSPVVKTLLKTFNIVVIPILVILAGLLVWFRWVSRQKKIAAMFLEDENE